MMFTQTFATVLPVTLLLLSIAASLVALFALSKEVQTTGPSKSLGGLAVINVLQMIASSYGIALLLAQAPLPTNISLALALLYGGSLVIVLGTRQTARS